MAATATLSVRLTPQTRRILGEAAATRDAAGASALARDILERWPPEILAVQTQAGIDRTAAYLRVHPEGWGDEPADFSPGVAIAEDARADRYGGLARRIPGSEEPNQRRPGIIIDSARFFGRVFAVRNRRPTQRRGGAGDRRRLIADPADAGEPLHEAQLLAWKVQSVPRARLSEIASFEAQEIADDSRGFVSSLGRPRRRTRP